MSFINIEKPLQEGIMIYGMRGSGKTELLKYLINQYDLQGIRTVIFDTMHNHNYTLKHGIIIQPSFSLKELTFIKTCKQVWKKGNTVFAIEEIDQFVTPQYMPKEIDSIVNVGRNRRISYIAITRRLAEVHGTIIGNADHHFIFKAFLPRDLEYYQKYVGKIVWQAKELQPYHFIYYRVGAKPQICKPIPLT